MNRPPESALTAILLCLTTIAGPSAAAEAPASLVAGEVLAGVQDWLDGTEDLEARFVQTLVSGALGAGLEERGRLFVQRPGRMRWNYAEPERKVGLVEGGRTRLYLEEERQLIEGTLEDAGGLLPILLIGERRLADLFQATLVDVDATGRDASYRLALVSREETADFQQVVLTVRRPSFAIEAAEVLDRTGNRLTYRFSSIRRNRGLEATLFSFEPPAGTEIVGAP